MSTATRNRREEVDVIIIDSDDEGPSTRAGEAGPSSRQQAVAPKLAGVKRNRDGGAHSSRRHSLTSYRLCNDEVVDLTSLRPSIGELSRQPQDDVCIVASDHNSPGAKRSRNIAVAKALEAHRSAGRQIAAHTHKIQHVAEGQERETKPKCGICLDEMKEPACGSCGHVFCKPCLLSCLKATKKCPTCRKTLQPRTVHRIYLS